MSLVGVYLELSVRCATCAHRVPINGCVTTATCPSCKRAVAVAHEHWTMVLGNLVQADAPLGKTASVSTFMDEADITLDHGREDPKCTGCGAAFPDDVAHLAPLGSATCAACGKRTSIRPPPAELAPLVRGAELVIGEDLDADHPVATVQRFYLAWPSAAAVAEAKRASFGWGTLYGAQVGADGELYAFGVGGGGWTVWCMGADTRVRWLTQHVESVSHLSDATIALDPTGRVLVWSGRQHSLEVFSSHDGASLGRLGGKQPVGALARTLDVGKLSALAVDRDGTLIALIGDHLCRFARDGSPLELWPPRSGLFGTKHEKLLPLYERDGSLKETEAVDPERVASRPHALASSSRLAVGWDGLYYVARDGWVAKLDRDGKIVYRTNVGSDVAGKVGADATGRAYVVARTDRQRSLLRISPDGKRVDTLQTDDAHGGALSRDDDTLCVGADGTTYHLHAASVLRVIAPDGHRLR